MTMINDKEGTAQMLNGGEQYTRVMLSLLDSRSNSSLAFQGGYVNRA